MLPAGQGSQLPDLQPAHRARSASGRRAWAAGLQLNHGSLTVREQSSRPRPAGVWALRGETVTQVLVPGRLPQVPRGLGGRRLHPQVAMSSEKWSCRLRLINLELNSLLLGCCAH